MQAKALPSFGSLAILEAPVVKDVRNFVNYRCSESRRLFLPAALFFSSKTR